MPTFFDIVPRDVHDAIARRIFARVDCGRAAIIYSLKDDIWLETLLNFAQIHPILRESVMRIMSYKLITYSWRETTILNWLFTFADQLQELELSNTRFTLPCFCVPLFPNIQRAFILAEPEQMFLMNHCPNLVELTVLIFDSVRWFELISMISFHSLKFLHLYTDERSRRRLNHLCLDELMGLQAAGIGLEYLVLTGEVHLEPPVWEMISGIDSLKKIGLEAYISDNHIPFLRSVTEIELYRVQLLSITQMSVLGPHITGLFEVTMDFAGLTYLTNLRRLSVFLDQGSESALSGLTNNLEEISLSWRFDHMIQDDEHCPWPLPFQSIKIYPDYYEPYCDVLETVLGNKPKLRSLKIDCAILKAESVERLLRNFGNRLEELSLPVHWQNEPTARRIERILKAIAQYCPKVKILQFHEGNRMEYSDADDEMLATKEQKECCRRALADVIRAAPHFSSEKHIRYIIGQRIADITCDLPMLRRGTVASSASDNIGVIGLPEHHNFE